MNFDFNLKKERGEQTACYHQKELSSQCKVNILCYVFLILYYSFLITNNFQNKEYFFLIQKGIYIKYEF